MNNELQKLISQLSMSVLEKLAGITIIRAVKNIFDTDNKEELATLIIYRYGETILNQPILRSALIETHISKDKAIDICKNLNIKFDDSYEYDALSKLLNRYEKSFNEKKAKEFINIFNLDETLIQEKIDDQRPASEIIKSNFGENLSSKGILHPYQKNVKDRASELIYTGKKRMLIQMPTGAGKTLTALELFTDYVRSYKFKGYIIWLVDSNELADQAYESFKSLWKLRGDREVKLYRYFGKFDNEYSDDGSGVVFAGFPSLNASYKGSNETKKNNLLTLAKNTSLIIVDEAHTSMADTYRQTIAAFKNFDNILIGLTATPARTSGFWDTTELKTLYGGGGESMVGIRDNNGNEIIEAIKYLQDEKYLARLDEKTLESESVIEGSSESKSCEQLAQDPNRNKLIVQSIESAYKDNEQTIVFACTKDHVIALIALLRSMNIEAAFVIGETPVPERNKIFERFKKGDLKIIINHEMLSTGIDLPNVNKLIITRPIGSPILYSQIIGRALRGPLNGGNEKNTIINVKDNIENYTSMNFLYRSFSNNFS